jgi:hypothetical protein
MNNFKSEQFQNWIISKLNGIKSEQFRNLNRFSKIWKFSNTILLELWTFFSNQWLLNKTEQKKSGATKLVGRTMRGSVLQASMCSLTLNASNTSSPYEDLHRTPKRAKTRKRPEVSGFGHLTYPGSAREALMVDKSSTQIYSPLKPKVCQCNIIHS